MIVMKFGGTSVEDAHAITAVIEIVRHQLSARPVVVLSATAGTTTTLITIAQHASAGRERDALALLQEVRRRHEQIAAALGLGSASRAELEALFESYFAELMSLVKCLAILGDLTPRALDTFCSYGERLSTAIVARAMIERGIPARHFDARQVITTDDGFTRANPLIDIIERNAKERLLPAVHQEYIPVTEGYIGATVKGITTTLGRGGSDYTAAILGAALNANEIQIWTDVDGVLTADPRIVPGAKKVKVLSFAEASELAYFGAKVLHPSTILPAISKNIPVRVLNSRKPDATGTIITSEIAPAKGGVKAIACKQGITMINVFSTRMLMAHGFLRRIFEVFEQFQTSVDLVSTSEVSVSVTVDNRDHLNQIVESLGAFSNVTVEENKAIICVVGEQLKYTPGIVGKVFKAIEDVNVFMISQGASEINVSFVIDEEKLPKVVQTLHEQFFSHVEEDIFEVTEENQ